MHEPTEKNKILMRKHGLVPENWLVVSESKSDLEIISRRSRQRRVLNKKK